MQGRKNTKSQGMPSEMSVRRTFLRLLGSLGNLRNYLMIRIGSNMSLLTATFTQQDILQSVWWELVPSTGTIMAVIRKWLLCPRTFILRTRTNKNSSSCTKIYRRTVPQSSTNQNKALTKKIYRKTIPRTWKKYVQQRKKNQNALLRNKKTQGMRLYMMFLILTSITYLNAEETILTCHIKERTWPLQAMNTLRRCLTILTNIMIVTAKYCPVKISKKLFSASWKRKNKKSNITTITLHAILNFSLQFLWMYKRSMQFFH